MNWYKKAQQNLPIVKKNESIFQEGKLIPGYRIARYITMLGTDDAGQGEGVTDYFRSVLKEQNFIFTSINLDQLISQDPDLKNYIDADRPRYNDYELEELGFDEETLDEPPIIGSWKYDNSKDGHVMDGMNRIYHRYKNGERNIMAFVSVESNFNPQSFRKEQGFEGGGPLPDENPPVENLPMEEKNEEGDALSEME